MVLFKKLLFIQIQVQEEDGNMTDKEKLAFLIAKKRGRRKKSKTLYLPEGWFGQEEESSKSKKKHMWDWIEEE